MYTNGKTYIHDRLHVGGFLIAEQVFWFGAKVYLQLFLRLAGKSDAWLAMAQSLHLFNASKATNSTPAAVYLAETRIGGYV